MSHNIYDDRHYVIMPINAAIYEVNFNQVLETSKHTIRKSVDGTKAFVKYEGDMPSSIIYISGRSQEYSHEAMIDILKTNEWSSPDDE